jgi:uncharacterized membrane protein YccC
MAQIKPPTKQQLDEARKAAEFARNTRAYHKWRTEPGSRQRHTDCSIAVARLRRAMVPLRSYLGAAPFGPQTPEVLAMIERTKEASALLQRERRKLWKLCPNAFKQDRPGTSKERTPSHAH